MNIDVEMLRMVDHSRCDDATGTTAKGAQNQILFSKSDSVPLYLSHRRTGICIEMNSSEASPSLNIY